MNLVELFSGNFKGHSSCYSGSDHSENPPRLMQSNCLFGCRDLSFLATSKGRETAKSYESLSPQIAQTCCVCPAFVRYDNTSAKVPDCFCHAPFSHALEHDFHPGKFKVVQVSSGSSV